MTKANSARSWGLLISTRYLEEAFELAIPGQTHVVGGGHLVKANGPTGWKSCNLRMSTSEAG